MSFAPVVLYENRGLVAWVTMNRPEARNAMSPELVSGMLEALHRAERDDSAIVVVLTGAGDRAFCAGGDLKAGKSTFEFDHSRPSSDIAKLFQFATRLTKPIVARVNGHVMAGGMGMLAMCDLAVAADTALFGLPEVKIGLFPMQVDALLQRLIPRRKLVEMSLTGEPLSAQDALTIGLVNHICPKDELDAKLQWLLDRLLDKAPTALRLGKHAMESIAGEPATAAEALAFGLLNYVVPRAELDSKIQWLVSRIMDKSPAAIRRGKNAMRAIADMPMEASLSFTEHQLPSVMLMEDAKEGRSAFNEKRAPLWKGR